MRGSKKKYVYIKVGKDRYVKARVFLRGEGEPIVTADMDPERIILTGTIVKTPPHGYKVFDVEDVPESVFKRAGGIKEA
jgi:hypothetical protein